jgi:hypothetical protein
MAGPIDQRELLAVGDLVREYGMPIRTVRRRLIASNVPVWIDPTDHRRRLVRRDDFEQVMRPRLARGQEVSAAA